MYENANIILEYFAIIWMKFLCKFSNFVYFLHSYQLHFLFKQIYMKFLWTYALSSNAHQHAFLKSSYNWPHLT